MDFSGSNNLCWFDRESVATGLLINSPLDLGRPGNLEQVTHTHSGPAMLLKCPFSFFGNERKRKRMK